MLSCVAGDEMCEVTSWIPHAVVETLRDRSAQPVIAWLTLIRASIEEYDPLVAVRPPSVVSEESESDGAFDEILSQLGKEIYKLDEYQRNLVLSDQDMSKSILNIFDECLDGMNRNEVENETKVISIPKQVEVETDNISECEKRIDVSFDTSTPVKSETVAVTPPVPPRKIKMRSPSPSISDDIEITEETSESDSVSTCWSYKECNIDSDLPKGTYATVWSQSSGYHNSDDILRQVLSQAQQHATISRLSFDTASDLCPRSPEVGGRCAVASMTRPSEDGYEPVRDALTDENIYEEIEYGCYTDEGCSCGSVEVESCSMSASSEGVGRESPMYANLRDHDAYAVTSDVIYWKNLLQDPFYNEDEEDEWITPEECEVYSRDRRPPLVIPRITQYRAPRKSPRQSPQIPYSEVYDDVSNVPAKSWQWSPTVDRSRVDLERNFGKACDYPPLYMHNKRLGGSTENLLANIRRPNQIHLPPSSSGDSLDVEVRERKPYGKQERKSRSLVATKTKSRLPQPSPRLTVHPTEDTIIYEGPIKRTKFLEGGKKCKKNWVDCYLTLSPTALRFYKDQRTYSATKIPKPPSPTTAPRAELILSLRNAHVVPCLQSYTRRYSRSLVLTVDHDQFLLQEETDESAKALLKAIQNVIYKLGPPLTDDRPIPPCSSSTDLESLGRTPPASRHVNRAKPRVGGSSNEDLSDSTEQSIQNRSYVRNKLRKFFARRPTMEVLVKNGIYKDEPVFGRKLEEVCPLSAPRVPEFVKACVREIESSEENLGADGLYRASGNLSQVQKIRLEVDQNNFSVIESNTDIHVLTGSLKLFFRELKEPLIPYTLFDRVLAACSIKPREARIKEFRDIVQCLPQCNRDTLKYLLEHLLKVTQYSERNRMHNANMAIVFGPTLLWAEKPENMAIDCIQQNHVVDILLNDYKEIFAEDPKTKKKA